MTRSVLIGVTVAIAVALGLLLMPKRANGPQPPSSDLMAAKETDPVAAFSLSLPQLATLENAYGREQNFRTVLELAYGYGEALLSDPETAAHARQGLSSNRNVYVMGNTAYWLQAHYNRDLESGDADESMRVLAEFYFEQALALDPTLDRNRILPQVNPEEVAAAREAEAARAARLAERMKGAADELLRLSPTQFPELPEAIADLVFQRKCGIPQPTVWEVRPGPRNVIHGEFIAPGKESWAVFCSDGATTDLLVFEGPEDAEPDVVTQYDDQENVNLDHTDTIVFSRSLYTASRDYIREHWEAYGYFGGEGEPPVNMDMLDHEGIDDGYLDKASVIWYFDHGEWFQLPGAD